MKRLDARVSLIAVAVLSLSLLSCAGAPVRKVSPQEGKVFIGNGPEAGMSFSQVLTSTTDVVWTLTRGSEKREKQRSAGLKLHATFTVKERKGESATIEVNLEKIEILKGNEFITAPFSQFSPPNPLTMVYSLKERKASFPGLEEAYREWAEGLRGTPIWEVMGESFDVEAFVSQLQDLLAAPLRDFPGETLSLGEETTDNAVFLLPYAGPSLTVGPVEVTKKFNLRGVLDVPDGKVALVEGKLFSSSLSPSPEVVKERFSLFGADTPLHYETEGELGGRFRARVDVKTGWTLQDSRKLHAITIINFEGGKLKEEVFGRKNIYERE